MKQAALKRLFKYVLWLAAVFIADRVTKFYALRLLATNYDVNPFLQFKLVFNRGVSWGMFHSEHTGFFTLLTLFIIAIICLLIRHTVNKTSNRKNIYAECAVLAGAVSNVIDRIIYGGVIDFIHVHIGNWSWPIFNVADIAIVLGVAWILWEHYNES